MVASSIICEATKQILASSQLLAAAKCHVVLSKVHGLRVGSSQLVDPRHLPLAVIKWLKEEGLDSISLSAPHFRAEEWQISLEDQAFPAALLRQGGRLSEDYVKVLFVNSFDPGLQFVLPYLPTECMATLLLQDVVPVDACV